MKKINLLWILVLSACSFIPASGPQTGKVARLGKQAATAQIPAVELIDVDNSVTQALYQAQNNQSFAQLGDGSASGGLIHTGDMLDITIWEAPPAVLFGGSLSSADQAARSDGQRDRDGLSSFHRGYCVGRKKDCSGSGSD